MLILSSMYIFYLVLLFTDRVSLYVIDKTFLLVLWYYFFYKALFLKVIHLDHTFESGWGLPDLEEDTDDDKVVRNRKASYAKGMLRKYRRGLNVKSPIYGKIYA